MAIATCTSSVVIVLLLASAVSRCTTLPLILAGCRFVNRCRCPRLSFEQLLRKLLGVPGRPAVLLLHWWSPYINRHAFYFSSEDGINTVAAYYGELHCCRRLPGDVSRLDGHNCSIRFAPDATPKSSSLAPIELVILITVQCMWC